MHFLILIRFVLILKDQTWEKMKKTKFEEFFFVFLRESDFYLKIWLKILIMKKNERTNFDRTLQ